MSIITVILQYFGRFLQTAGDVGEVRCRHPRGRGCPQCSSKQGPALCRRHTNTQPPTIIQTIHTQQSTLNKSSSILPLDKPARAPLQEEFRRLTEIAPIRRARSQENLQDVNLTLVRRKVHEALRK